MAFTRWCLVTELCACITNRRRSILIFCVTFLGLMTVFHFGKDLYVPDIHIRQPVSHASQSVGSVISEHSHVVDNTWRGPIQILRDWKLSGNSGNVTQDNSNKNIPNKDQNVQSNNASVIKGTPIPTSKPDTTTTIGKTTTTTTTTTTPSPAAPRAPAKVVPDTANDGQPANDNTAKDTADQGQELCPEISPHLVGPISVDMTPVSWEELMRLHPEVSPAGTYTVKECKSRHKMAIVIPYRDRDEHLRIFLNHMIPVFIRQQLDFGVYVINQLDGSTFNRGILMNIGFVEALKADDYKCFIFTDVDLLVENDKNIYGCPAMPRHMSVAIDKLNYRLPYAAIFGGTENFRKEHYEKVNGFSNKYFGWGGEDDDLYQRVIKAGLKLIRPPKEIARYKMSKHKKARASPQRFNHLRTAKSRMSHDGLNTLVYDVEKVEKDHLHTKVSVRLNQQAILDS